MPALDEHISQAISNVDFLQPFVYKKSNDWAVTVMFYTALHIVEAVIWKKVNNLRQNQNNYDYEIHSPNHDYRERVVRELLPEIHFSYTQLSKAAHDGRYKVYKFKNQTVSFHINSYFIPIVDFFNKFAADEALNRNISCNLK
jgi:hypothetical protein